MLGATSSYGSAYNTNGGGIMAMEWRDAGIRMWQFDRDSIPTDITDQNPDPSSWGTASADFPNTDCSISSHFKNQSIIGFAIGVVIEKYPERIRQALHQLCTWLKEGKLKPTFDQTFSLDKASAAHTAILNRETSGKVILTVDTK